MPVGSQQQQHGQDESGCGLRQRPPDSGAAHAWGPGEVTWNGVLLRAAGELWP